MLVVAGAAAAMCMQVLKVMAEHLRRSSFDLSRVFWNDEPGVQVVVIVWVLVSCGFLITGHGQDRELLAIGVWLCFVFVYIDLRVVSCGRHLRCTTCDGV
jgi:hypothetical protein